MEIDNLLKKIRNQEEEPNRFLALEITDEIVQTAVWQVKNEKTELVSIGTAEYWNGSEKNKLIDAVDKSLTKATEGMVKEPGEIVFGIPHNWVKNEGIIADKKELIKTISKELELKPLGFVVLTESLIRYLKIREGTPATAILIHLTDSEITVSLVTLGRIMATHTVGRSDDIARDVEEGISRFKVDDNLPSRIIIFNGTQDMEEIVQNLTSYDWQSKFKFLHLPKIEALPKDAGISAVAVAGGSEVAKSIGFEINFDEPKEKEISQKSKAESVSLATSPTPSPVNQESSLKDLGFVEGKDIGQMKKQPDIPQSTSAKAKPPAPQQSAKPDLPKPYLSFASGFLGKLKSLKLPNLPRNFTGKIPKGPIAIIAGVLIFLIISVFVLLWFVPKTEIALYLEPKNLEQSIDLTISERVSSPDQDNNIIPGTTVSKTVKGEKSADATGTKIIGDPAKGEVTIYNRTSLEKTFQQGTIISYNNLDFTLDSNVTIASESADTDYAPGQATVAITADQIGVESNLEADIEFIVDDFSKDSYVAKNSAALTGGTSEEMKVVSEDDRDNILQALTNELEEKAKNDLMQEANSEKGVFIQDELTDVISSNFSAEAGEEVGSVTLSLEIETKGLSYNNSDVEQLITGNVEQTMPSGYERAEAPIEVKTSSTESGDDEVILDATIKVKLLPKVETDVLATTIKNMKAADLESVFKDIPGFKRAEVSIQPRWLPPRWKKVSRNPKNITIEIKSL